MEILKMSFMTLKNLFSPPATRRYPAKTREPFPAARGRITINIDACTFCTLCAKKCPSQAITVEREKKVWTIDPLRCIMCRYCVETCPRKCLSQETKAFRPLAERVIETYTRPEEGEPREAQSADCPIVTG